MKRILVVDDEQDICEILQFNLENAGYWLNRPIQPIRLSNCC
jgi:CheY-like chemotaxis protein